MIYVKINKKSQKNKRSFFVRLIKFMLGFFLCGGRFLLLFGLCFYRNSLLFSGFFFFLFSFFLVGYNALFLQKKAVQQSFSAQYSTYDFEKNAPYFIKPAQDPVGALIHSHLNKISLLEAQKESQQDVIGALILKNEMPLTGKTFNLYEAWRNELIYRDRQEILNVQKGLKKFGFSALKISGRFDRPTFNALLLFMQKNAMAPSEKTWVGILNKMETLGLL